MTSGTDGGIIRVPVLLGPTATGKTGLALKIALEFDMDIISCDSRQIYRYMDIGTAKPSAKELKLVKHWMIDTTEPDNAYSCYQFGMDAGKIIREHAAKGKNVLICGGSGLYFNSLRNGVGPTVPPQKCFREKWLEKVHSQGNKYLFDELMRVDPETACTSHPSNVQRNIRALEVYCYSGIPLSSLKSRSLPPQGIDFFVMSGTLPRHEIYRRIDNRVDSMINNGLMDEFRALLQKGYDITSPGMQCVGYKELFIVKDNPASLRLAVDEIKKNTRHYAKRQMTWFRHQVKTREVNMDDGAFEAAKNMIGEYLKS